MIKQLLVITAVFMVFSDHSLAAPRIMSVQSMTVPPYEEVIRGFGSVCSEKLDRVVLSEIPPGAFQQTVKELEPELILAVGLSALNEAVWAEHPPIVYAMVLPQDIPKTGMGKGITGVLMQIPAEMQLANIEKVLPGATRIGLLFDPEQSSKIVGEARFASQRMGIELIAEAVETPKDILTALQQMKGRAEVIWMLPDITVSMPRTLELFTLFSLENRIPLVAYSEKYLEIGAFMSIGLDLFDMGRQAGELANAILAGGDLSSLPPREANAVVITINTIIADKFAIKIDKTTLDGVKVFDRD